MIVQIGRRKFKTKVPLQARGRIFQRTIGAALFVVCLALSIFCFSETDQEDPVYNGRRLSAWIKLFDGKPDQIAAAKQAISALGTNAVPALMWLRLKPDARMDRILATLLKPVHSSFRPPTEKRRYQARAGLIVLGTNAAFALLPGFAVEGPPIRERGNPFLVEKHPIHQLADVMLYDLQTNSVPAFTDALQGGSRVQRYNVCYALWSHPTVEVHGNNALGVELIEAIIPCLEDEAPEVVVMAVYALTAFKARAVAGEAVLKRVIPLLRHPHSGVRVAAALFLESPVEPSVRVALTEALERERATAQDDVPEDNLAGRRSKSQVIQMLTFALRNEPEK